MGRKAEGDTFSFVRAIPSVLFMGFAERKGKAATSIRKSLPVRYGTPVNPPALKMVGKGGSVLRAIVQLSVVAAYESYRESP